jgi:hypothetical protein
MTPSATSRHLKGYQGQSPWLVRLREFREHAPFGEADPNIRHINESYAGLDMTMASAFFLRSLWVLCSEILFSCEDLFLTANRHE